MSEKNWMFKPVTKIGIWSVVLIAVMPLLFIIGPSLADSLYDSVTAGRTILEDISLRPILALTMLAGMAAGMAGFVTGLMAIFKHKEKAFLVYLSTVIGGLLTLYLIGEVVFPH